MPKLYVRLVAGGDPGAIGVTVAAELGFYVSLMGETHPDLGEVDLLSGLGDFES
jgi:hypothetical protein